MRDNLIIFPATTSYLAEARVLLKSLVRHMPGVPVHVTSRNGEADSLKEFPNVELIINEEKCDSEFRQIRTARFRHAVDVSDNYLVTVILDADMLCLRNFESVFRMADTGTILAGSNNTIFRYLFKDFKAMQIDADPNINTVHTSFCSVPLFINASIHKEYLLNIWNNPTGNDLDVNNLLAARDLMHKFYLLTSYSWLNIHHSCLKHETHIKKDGAFYYSHQGEPVYMMHGHWLDSNYVANLLEPIQKNYGYYPPYVECAKNCIRIIEEAYAEYR